MRLKSPGTPRRTALAASVVVTLAVGLGTTAVPLANAAPHADKAKGASSDARQAVARDPERLRQMNEGLKNMGLDG